MNSSPIIPHHSQFLQHESEPLPDLNPIPLSASLVSMRKPDGRFVRILDIYDYIAFMEHLGYVRLDGAE